MLKGRNPGGFSRNDDDYKRDRELKETQLIAYKIYINKHLKELYNKGLVDKETNESNEVVICGMLYKKD